MLKTNQFGIRQMRHMINQSISTLEWAEIKLFSTVLNIPEINWSLKINRKRFIERNIKLSRPKLSGDWIFHWHKYPCPKIAVISRQCRLSLRTAYKAWEGEIWGQIFLITTLYLAKVPFSTNFTSWPSPLQSFSSLLPSIFGLVPPNYIDN